MKITWVRRWLGLLSEPCKQPACRLWKRINFEHRLFGITILQAFRYFVNYVSDKRFRKQFVSVESIFSVNNILSNARSSTSGGLIWSCVSDVTIVILSYGHSSFLDALHFSLSAYMVYYMFVVPGTNPISGYHVLWWVSPSSSWIAHYWVLMQ